MKNFLLVAIGGAGGATSRYALSLLAARYINSWPLGTFAANITGCTLAGLICGYMAGRSTPETLLLSTGFLGGFTTLSALSIETATMIEQGRLAQAFLYSAGTFLLALAACITAIWIGRNST